MTIGRRIAELRKKQGMTQEQLAEAIGTTRQAVSKWESSKSTPDVEFAIQIGKLFEVSINYLLLGENSASAVQGESSLMLPTKKTGRTYRRTVYFVLFAVGICLLCLTPLFASLYQSRFMAIGAPYYTDANLYLSEWPMLGVVIVCWILLLVGLVGITLPYLKKLIGLIQEN